MNIQTDRALVPAGSPSVRYCTVTITAPTPAPVAEADEKAARPAASVALVIDRSGSMGAPAAAPSVDTRGAWRGGGAPRNFLTTKIGMAKKAVTHAMRLLHERDRLAVVCYDHDVDVLLAASPAGAEAKTLAASRLRALDARGNTDLHAGWRAGAEQAGARPASPSGVTGPVQRSKEEPGDVAHGEAGALAQLPAKVMLLTDGLANQGQTDPDTLAAEAARLRSDGITTSTFGVGADFDETLLARIATAGGGHFYFIEHAAQIPDVFTSELGEALDIVAHNAELIVRDSLGAKTICLNEFATDEDEDGLHIRVGDLSAGQSVTLVLATEIGPRAEGASTAILLRVADRDRVLYGAPMEVAWQAVDADADSTQPINRDVIVAAAMLLAERARAEALELNRRGHFSRARKTLTAAIASIRALGAGIPGVDAIAAELASASATYAAPMAAMTMKREYFQSYTVRNSRDSAGRGRKAPTPS